MDLNSTLQWSIAHLELQDTGLFCLTIDLSQIVWGRRPAHSYCQVHCQKTASYLWCWWYEFASFQLQYDGESENLGGPSRLHSSPLRGRITLNHIAPNSPLRTLFCRWYDYSSLGLGQKLDPYTNLRGTHPLCDANCNQSERLKLFRHSIPGQDHQSLGPQLEDCTFHIRRTWKGC